jgi:hypothetical protein
MRQKVSLLDPPLRKDTRTELGAVALIQSILYYFRGCGFLTVLAGVEPGLIVGPNWCKIRRKRRAKLAVRRGAVGRVGSN